MPKKKTLRGFIMSPEQIAEYKDLLLELIEIQKDSEVLKQLDIDTKEMDDLGKQGKEAIELMLKRFSKKV